METVKEFFEMSEEDQKARKASLIEGSSFAEKRERLIDLVEATENQEMIDLLPIFLKASRKGAGIGRVRKDSKAEKIRELFMENSRVSDMDIFLRLRMGGHEVTQTCYNMRKNETDPERVLWIQKDPVADADGTYYYVLKGTGFEKPADWIEKGAKKKTVDAFSSPDETEDDE